MKGQSWALGLAQGLTAAGAIMLLSIPVRAQTVREDNTLGAENSRVVRDVQIRGRESDRIDGGARRGQNLFHSFEQFNVPEGRGAYFLNPNGVRNIFSRVTGGDRSEINGALGVIQGDNLTLGSANLFFINPNGILFGVNSSLDVGGSFVGTTANGMQFGDRGIFNATKSEASSLLTVSPSAFLFNQPSASSIENRSNFNVFGLQVPDGRSLILLGGNVNFSEAGGIVALGGRIDLGGLSNTGTVALNIDNNSLHLVFPENAPRADVSFNDGASVIAYGDGNGDIVIHARNITLSGGSFISTGIDRNLGTVDFPAGNIIVDATGVVTIDQESYIDNNVNRGSSGRSGDISINSTGSVNIGQASFIENFVVPNSSGRSGSINIRASQLNIQDQAVRAANNSGIAVGVSSNATGQGGDVTIDAEQVTLTGSNARIQTITRGNGNSGSVSISAGRLSVRDGAQVSASTFGRGNSGNLTIRDADLVELTGEGEFAGGLFAQVNPGATGSGGRLTIETRRLSVSDGSKVQIATFGNGSAGELLKITADEVDIFETPRHNTFSTGIFAGAQTDRFQNTVSPEGNGGNLSVTARQISIRGGEISASTSGLGNAGRLFIRASERVEVIGTSADIGRSSSISADVFQGARGQGGDLTIVTRQLNIRNGGIVSANTSGQGSAGNISIRGIRGINRTSLDNGTLSTTVNREAVGQGGNIRIQANSLELGDRSRITSSTFGQGNAGNISINATGTLRSRDSSITTEASRASGGAINILAGDIRLRGNSDIRTQVEQGAGGGGNINIDAGSLVAFNDSDIIAAAKDGQGGNISFGDTIAFFENYQPNAATANPGTLENNQRADINATGAQPGTITLPDTSFIQNSLTDLPENALDADSLISNSCIARTQQGGTFLVTGSGGLPPRPGVAPLSPYPAGTVRTQPDEEHTTAPAWHRGEPIVEPQGVYQLEDGELVLSRECH